MQSAGARLSARRGFYHQLRRLGRALQGLGFYCRLPHERGRTGIACAAYPSHVESRLPTAETDKKGEVGERSVLRHSLVLLCDARRAYDRRWLALRDRDELPSRQIPVPLYPPKVDVEAAASGGNRENGCTTEALLCARAANRQVCEKTNRALGACG